MTEQETVSHEFLTDAIKRAKDLIPIVCFATLCQDDERDAVEGSKDGRKAFKRKLIKMCKEYEEIHRRTLGNRSVDSYVTYSDMRYLLRGFFTHLVKVIDEFIEARP